MALLGLLLRISHGCNQGLSPGFLLWWSLEFSFSSHSCWQNSAPVIVALRSLFSCRLSSEARSLASRGHPHFLSQHCSLPLQVGESLSSEMVLYNVIESQEYRSHHLCHFLLVRCRSRTLPVLKGEG